MTVETAQDAERLVEREVVARSRHDLAIQPELTAQRAFGWVVYYTSREFIRTRSPSALVPGTGPVIVLRDGRIVEVSTSVPPNVAIAEYEARWLKGQEGQLGRP